MDQQQQRVEALGPAERIIASLTTFTDHLVHNRTLLTERDTGRNTSRQPPNVTAVP